MNNNHTLIVVGDKFNQFAQAENAVTFSQFSAVLDTPSKLFMESKIFVPGQGVRQDYYSKIISSINTDEKKSSHLNIDKLASYYQYEKGINSYTHQRDEHNILIGQATKKNDTNYELPFIIDERSTLMGDHQTGRHVQGMIITEAFRQSFIAVTEEFYLQKDNKERYFVINNMDIKFKNFIFPLPATISFELINIDNSIFRTKIQARLEIIQNKIKCAAMEVGFVVYPTDYIEKKEQALAENAISSYLKSI